MSVYSTDMRNSQVPKKNWNVTQTFLRIRYLYVIRHLSVIRYLSVW